MRAARLSRETFCECIMAVWCRPPQRAGPGPGRYQNRRPGRSAAPASVARRSPGVVRLHLGYQQARGREGTARPAAASSSAGLLPTSFYSPRRRAGRRRAGYRSPAGSTAARQNPASAGSGGQRRRRRRSGFFGDTGQVVIEGGAADDIFGGFDEIGRFINDARRIAGASADHFLPLFMPIATMRGRR